MRTALNGLIKLGKDIQPAMREIAGALESGVEDAFQSERSPDGKAWPDLADVTKRQRAMRRKWPGQILQDSGDLAGSIHSRYGGNHAVAGTNLVYATTQQFGASKGEFGTGSFKRRAGSFPIPWGDIPPRPFLGLSDETRGEIVTMLNRRIRQAARGRRR